MEKWSSDQYVSQIQKLKEEANGKMWLYLELNARDLMTQCEPGTKNLNAACKGMLAQMLEGDSFVVEPKVRSKIAGNLTVRYYVDNLSPERRRWQDVKN